MPPFERKIGEFLSQPSILNTDASDSDVKNLI